MHCRYCGNAYKPWKDPSPFGDLRRCRKCEGKCFPDNATRYCRECGKPIPQIPMLQRDGSTTLITGGRDLCERCNPFTGTPQQMKKMQLVQIVNRLDRLAIEDRPEMKTLLIAEIRAIVELLKNL